MNPNYAVVASRAGHTCEYRHAPEAVFNLRFEVEHIILLSRGGSREIENLALSCRSCNLYKSDAVSGFSETTRTDVRLFNPRRDIWIEHFWFNKETGEINGLTDTGQAAVSRLRINSRAQLAARVQWAKLGFFD